MRYDFRDNSLSRRFILTTDVQKEVRPEDFDNSLIQFNWNQSDQKIPIVIDGMQDTLDPHQITTFTYHHKITYPDAAPIAGILFNRDFYCIADHDAEIGCNGILFFGTQDLPVLTLDDDHQRKLLLLWQVMIDEFGQNDNVQGEMLQMLLKRFIIICTRLAKEQLITKQLNNAQLDIIRKFNVLVDLHFREKRQVQEYAELLHRSPKTLSNLFGKYGKKSPLQIIQERVALEAKRLLFYTDSQIQEIAYDLGFEDPGHFSKFFKKASGLSPQAFRSKG